MHGDASGVEPSDEFKRLLAQRGVRQFNWAGSVYRRNNEGGYDREVVSPPRR